MRRIDARRVIAAVANHLILRRPFARGEENGGMGSWPRFTRDPEPAITSVGLASGPKPALFLPSLGDALPKAPGIHQFFRPFRRGCFGTVCHHPSPD
jgi:hypothetical protein